MIVAETNGQSRARVREQRGLERRRRLADREVALLDEHRGEVAVVVGEEQPLGDADDRRLVAERREEAAVVATRT